MKECCGNCKWHQYDDKYDDWLCCGADSEDCGDYTTYNHCCDDFEEKEWSNGQV